MFKKLVTPSYGGIQVDFLPKNIKTLSLSLSCSAVLVLLPPAPLSGEVEVPADALAAAGPGVSRDRRGRLLAHNQVGRNGTATDPFTFTQSVLNIS